LSCEKNWEVMKKGEVRKKGKKCNKCQTAEEGSAGGKVSIGKCLQKKVPGPSETVKKNDRNVLKVGAGKKGEKTKKRKKSARGRGKRRRRLSGSNRQQVNNGKSLAANSAKSEIETTPERKGEEEREKENSPRGGTKLQLEGRKEE